MRVPHLVRSASQILVDPKAKRSHRFLVCLAISALSWAYFFVSARDGGNVYEPAQHWTFGSGTRQYFVGFIVFLVGSGSYFLFAHHERDYSVLRMLFTVPALALLSYRAFYYSQRGALLYLIDFCFWSHVCGLAVLWAYGSLSRDFCVGVFAALNGPVGGATFLLRTPLLVHHPEAFESFFLHVVPMWASYSLRWNWGDKFFDKDDMSVLGIVKKGFMRVYLPWVLFYGSFLTLQPYLPWVANMETLFDWYAYGGVPEERTDAFPVWTAKVWAYCAVHCIMATQGLFAAALSFRSRAVHLAWIFCVIAGTVRTGIMFYIAGLQDGPSVEPENKLIAGFKDCAAAWVVILVVAALSRPGKTDKTD